MKLIIDVDEAMYKRICEAQSVPDMYGTDVVNAINRIKKGTPVSAELATNLQPTCKLLQQGEWIGNAFDEHHCSRCGHPALWEEEPDGYYEVQSRFCPNCGADMRKGGAEMRGDKE